MPIIIEPTHAPIWIVRGGKETVEHGDPYEAVAIVVPHHPDGASAEIKAVVGTITAEDWRDLRARLHKIGITKVWGDRLKSRGLQRRAYVRKDVL